MTLTGQELRAEIDKRDRRELEDLLFFMAGWAPDGLRRALELHPPKGERS